MTLFDGGEAYTEHIARTQEAKNNVLCVKCKVRRRVFYNGHIRKLCERCFLEAITQLMAEAGDDDE